ncbi:MAG: DNA topoisomerase VI subunit B [Candidatus Lindowbacteria bacterium]|nr:DNA topoisomerase VI subunit B [Candidatus Lindowbacteria bacterium]
MAKKKKKAVKKAVKKTKAKPKKSAASKKAKGKTSKKTKAVSKKKPAKSAKPAKAEIDVEAHHEEAEDRGGMKKTAKEMAEGQREISVSEFFTKNRHLLGFDNPKKALLTTVKEAVDNAVDACEEAGILPEVRVELKQLSSDRYTVAIEDNGPGIVRAQVPKIFGKLLYGSKFHRLKQSRGQQGIGISAAAMYGHLTTGSSCRITSKTGKRKQAHFFLMHMDTKRNEPEIMKDEVVKWNKNHGTRVEIDLEGTFSRGKRGVEEYLSHTLVANPHVTIIFKAPDKEEERWPRATTEPPLEAAEIKPHPYGVELGILMQMLKSTKARNLGSFLKTEFSRVGSGVANQICDGAKLKTKARPSRIARQEADNLYKSIQQTKIMRPPTNCLSPIGEKLLLKGLRRIVPDAELYTAVSRGPSVYRGNPFLIEVALSWGGSDRSAESQAEMCRFANRVPLQYQQAACSITKGVIGMNWRSYGVSQAKGAIPSGPLVIAVHIASVWVPFTSESKEAIAAYPEILKEIKLGLQECGRRLGGHIRKKRRIEDAEKKKSYIKSYIPQVAAALQQILALSDNQTKKTITNLTEVLEKTRKIG